VRPVEDLLPFLPALEVGADEARLLRNGIRIEAPADAPAEPLRIVSGGELIAVARVAEGRLRTEVVLPF
jgi:hypothetical protein